MRRLLTILAALLLVVIGGAGWVLVQYLQHPNRNGEVRGETSVWPGFWQGGFLALTGGPDTQLTIIRETGIEAAALPARPPITSAAVSPDQTTLIVVRHDGDQSIFWRYREGAPPVPLTAVRGDVEMMRISRAGRDALVLLRRDGTPMKQLAIVNLENGVMVQVSADAEHAEWIEQPLAVVSVDARGQIWYHAVQLDGRVDPPQYLTSAASDIAVAPGRPELYFATKTDDGFTLRSFSLITREQRLIAPLTGSVAERPMRLRLAPDGKTAALTAARDAAEENEEILLISLDTGKVETLAAIARDIRWRDETTLFFERVTGSAVHLWQIRRNGDPEKLFDTPMSRFGA